MNSKPKSKPSLLLKAPLLDVTAGHFRGRAVFLIEPFETYALVRLDGETVVMPTKILRPRRFWRRLLFRLLGIRPRFPRLYREPAEQLATTPPETQPAETIAAQLPADPPASPPTMKAPCPACASDAPIAYTVTYAPPCETLHSATQLNAALYAQLLRARRQTAAALTPSRN